MELKQSYSASFMSSASVLIVPYGIETPEYGSFLIISTVLIVPYGIETPVLNNSLRPLKCVNCTLWN